MKILTTLALSALGLSLLAAPVRAELCLEKDGVYRTCPGTYVAPKEDKAQQSSWEHAQLQAAREAAQEAVEASNTYRQSARQDLQQRSEQRAVDRARRFAGQNFQRKSEVEQRYYLSHDAGFSNDAVNHSYGR